MPGTDVSPRRPEPAWTLDATAALAALDSDACGLDPQEAARRLERVGPNRLAERRGRSPLWLFASQFRSFLSLLLVAAAAMAFVVGEIKDAVVVGGVVLFNAVLGFVQEYRAEAAVAALRKMLTQSARVRRGGDVEDIAAEGLVPGDVVLLEAGDRVPADGRLIVAHALEIDESSLTGESVPVAKQTRALPDPELAIGDRVNVAFMNTAVTRGRGELLITATGAETETGRLAALLERAPERQTPLQIQMDALGRRLAVIAGVAVAIIATVRLLGGTAPAQVALEAVAIAVAAIPEGLPAVVTVTLALGMHRMAQQRAVVRRMSAVETLGCTTDICSDKTGTLTLNQMTARQIVIHGDRLQVTGEGYAEGGEIQGASAATQQLHPLLRAAALCNDSDVQDGVASGDPTEAALWMLAARGGVDVEALRREHPRVAEVPFDSERKLSATVHEDGALFAKGAPDALLARCDRVLGPDGPVPLDDDERRRVEAANEALAGDALRVLAIATRAVDPSSLPTEPDALADEVRGLVLVGLVGLLDPPRPDARDVIKACRRAGIVVRMITGDHAATGSAIARAVGIEGDAITGRELDRLDDAELTRRMPELGVIARVSPEHKLRIVDALRAGGRVVAMLGDGVNDAPALKRADIGVAMGITGTEVTKEAATVVLSDDNFATIVGAVREGRRIYDNIVRFLRFQLSTNIGALVTVFLAPLLALPMPFTPIQILWVNIIMDGPPAMALGLDPANPDVMDLPPRDPSARILTGWRLAEVAWFGGIMAAGTLGVLAWSGSRTLAFTTFVLFQLFNVSNARFEGRTALQRQSFTNPQLWAALAVVLLLQVLAVHLPVLQGIFDTEALTLAEWGVAAGVASSVLVLEEVRKLVLRLARR